MEEQEFQYNDEFFFDPLMRERAERDFSAIWFALYSEKISKEFREHDETAKRLKREFQTWGFRVVGFAVLALSIAALEPTFLPQVVDAGYLPDISGEIVATIAALAGVTSIAMGFFGMGFSSRKTHWLEVRLLCERIRQWRWQYFCAHSLEALAASSNLQLQEEYTSGRDKYFSDFIEGLKKDAQRALRLLLTPAAEQRDAAWISPAFKADIQHADLPKALDPQNRETANQQLVAAYSNIRIGAQGRYARYLVRDTGPFTTHPATQRVWLRKRGFVLLMAIFILHIMVLAGAFVFHIPPLMLKVVHVSAVIFALIALGLRAIEDGLRPAEHLGRITGYLAEVSSIEEAFDEASTGEARRDLMIALEKASYKEMVDFLRAGNRSRYVM